MENLFFVQLPIILKSFIGSPFFLTLKLLLAIYITVLFADIIMLLILRGFGDVRATFRGMNIPMISPKKMRKKWDGIRNRMLTDDESQFKLAIIEGDAIVGEILEKMKLKGDNMSERMENLKPQQVDNLEDLKEAHKTRNQIIHNDKFKVDKALTKKTLEIYETFLRDFEFLED